MSSVAVKILHEPVHSFICSFGEFNSSLRSSFNTKENKQQHKTNIKVHPLIPGFPTNWSIIVS